MLNKEKCDLSALGVWVRLRKETVRYRRLWLYWHGKLSLDCSTPLADPRPRRPVESTTLQWWDRRVGHKQQVITSFGQGLQIGGFYPIDGLSRGTGKEIGQRQPNSTAKMQRQA